MILNEKIFVHYNGNIDSFKQLNYDYKYYYKIVFIAGDDNNLAIYTHGKFYKTNKIYDNEVSDNLHSKNLIIHLTYSELKEFINSNSLVPGMKYRITDFTTYKTKYHNTKVNDKEIIILSDRHPFDIIVTASSNNTLESKASAVLNENDNYFSRFGCNLEKWELEYEIEPDENKLDDYYTGTITYMKDEYGNEATYDFKNIMFDVSNVGNLSDFLNTTYYGAKRKKPVYTFSRLIQNVAEINGIDLISNAYYFDNNFTPDCYVADASLCNEYNIIIYNNYTTANLSFTPVENNIIKLKGEYKALFSCGNAYFNGATLEYGINYFKNLKHKANHNIIVNSYGNAEDKKGTTIFIIGSATSFINVNGMSIDNHCMNLSHSYVCVNENGKQIIDLSNLQQRLDNIDESVNNTYNLYYDLKNEFENFKDIDINNDSFTEIINNINKKINLNCSILPFTKIDENTPDIDATDKPTNPTGIVLIPNKNCLAAFDGSNYYYNWDDFIYNKVYFPSSTEYSRDSFLLRDINGVKNLYGSRFLIFNKHFPVLGSKITTDITEKLFIILLSDRFVLYTGYNYYGALNTNTYNIDIKFIQTSIQTPIKTSRVILAPGDYTVNFNIASTLGLTVVWENGEAPIIDSSKYNIFDFTEMYIDDDNIRLLITHNSCISKNIEVEEESDKDYIDLGLPSGTLWATKNVGANSSEEYGNYYAWGEIETKEEYIQSNCSTYDVQINDISGNEQYDAAYIYTNSIGRMPTKTQWEELINNCIIENIVFNSVFGYRITGHNGNFIFLPCGGYKSGTEHSFLETSCYYWSSTPGSELSTAFDIKINNIKVTYEHIWRYLGMNIRPVKNVKIDNQTPDIQ